ncbi:hypothetical protein J1614_010013 [Plenodomus biglobosus]|nr:hypothetical protein J1614_010013 [Plenodomus biglobosus]
MSKSAIRFVIEPARILSRQCFVSRTIISCMSSQPAHLEQVVGRAQLSKVASSLLCAHPPPDFNLRFYAARRPLPNKVRMKYDGY